MSVWGRVKTWQERRRALREIRKMDRINDLDDATVLRTRLGEAKLLLKAGGIEAAAEICASAHGRFPRLFESTPEALQTLIEIGQLDDAERLLARALRQKPYDSKLWAASAKLAETRKDDIEAARRWRKARTSIRPDRDVYFAEAACLRRLGRTKAEDAVLRKATKAHADFEWSHEAYAHAAMARKDWKEAHRRWARARLYVPSSSMIGMARCLDAMGRYDEADRWMTRTMEEFPRKEDAAVEFAWLAHRRRDWPAAARRWNHVRLEFPAARPGYIAGAEALRALGQEGEADQVLALGVTRQPRAEDLLAEDAWSAHHRKDWVEAVKRWSKLQTLYPNNSAVTAAGQEALHALREIEDADALLDVS